MPISNGSVIWPKVLVCMKCNQPVEREYAKETRVGEYLYSCASCDRMVLFEHLKWIEESALKTNGDSEKSIH